MPGPPLSRRRLLRSAGAASAIAAGVLTACDVDLSGSPSTRPTTPASPDETLLRAARTELSDLIARAGTVPGQRALLAAHHEQLAALGGHMPARSRRRRRPVTTAQLRARERRAAARFGHWATTCHDGDLARVLASIAGGIRMQPILRGSA